MPKASGGQCVRPLVKASAVDGQSVWAWACSDQLSIVNSDGSECPTWPPLAKYAWYINTLPLPLGCLDSNSSTILLFNRPLYLHVTIKVSHHAFYESFKRMPVISAPSHLRPVISAPPQLRPDISVPSRLCSSGDRGPSLNGVRGSHFMGLIVGGKAPLP